MQANKTGIVLVVGAIGYAIYTIVKKGTAIKALNWNFSGIDFNRADKTFVFKLRLINPANASIRIRSIVADVRWKGTPAAIVDYRTEIVLQPNEERILQLAIKPNLDLVTIITDLIQNKTKALNGEMELKGSINAEGLVVPIEYKQTIKLV
jgi:LEA14-like dessication related protein